MMVKSKTSKRIKYSKGSSSSNGSDRISNLPDHLISNILSLLSTKEAVATSVLSTRWKFLWTSMTKLKFDFKCGKYTPWGTPETKDKVKMNRRKYNRFVKKALLLLNPPSIHKFSLGLCCSHCINLEYLYSWISAGFGCSVREFTLELDNETPLQFPVSRICCNLADLDLSGDIYFNIPAAVSLCFLSLKAIHLNGVTCVIPYNSSISFPNLKIMRLLCVEFKNEGSVNKLLSSCPLLDDLIIEDATYNDDMEEFIIYIPSLTRLSINISTSEYEDMRKVKINAPALQYLHLDGWLTCECLIVENSSFLLLSDLKILFDYGNDINSETESSIVKFIGRVSEVKFLSIRSELLKVFRIVSPNITSGFHNLTRLEITFYHCLDLSMLISGFLESLDNLEHLVLKAYGIECPEQSWWMEPLNVPKCLMSRLTTVSFQLTTVFFRDINGCCDLLELLRYFLKNAKVLQMLTISTDRLSEKQQNVLLKKILLMPSASQTCEVAFIKKSFLMF